MSIFPLTKNQRVVLVLQENHLRTKKPNKPILLPLETAAGELAR